MGNLISFKRGDLVIASLTLAGDIKVFVQGEIVGKDADMDSAEGDSGFDWLVKISDYDGRRLKNVLCGGGIVWNKDDFQELFDVNFDKSIGVKPIFTDRDQYYLWCDILVLNDLFAYHEQKIMHEIFLGKVK